MRGISKGRGTGQYTTLNGPNPQINQVDIGQQATILVLQRIYQELKVI